MSRHLLMPERPSTVVRTQASRPTTIAPSLRRLAHHQAENAVLYCHSETTKTRACHLGRPALCVSLSVGAAKPESRRQTDEL